jgi:hypothetical protein
MILILTQQNGDRIDFSGKYNLLEGAIGSARSHLRIFQSSRQKMLLVFVSQAFPSEKIRV